MAPRTFGFRTRDGRDGIVRPARLRDARACLAIVAGSVAERPRTLAVLEEEMWTAREWRRHRLEWGRRGVWLVAEVEGEVVGQLSAERAPRPSMIHNAEFGITVAERARGAGVGRALLETLEVWASEVGVDRIALAVFVGNERAIGLYRSLGYVEEGRESGAVRFPEGDVDLVKMAKRLDAPAPRAASMKEMPHEGEE